MIKKYRTGNTQHNAGFTLLEVLIALLVLSVGLLGLASLQTRGLATGHNAYLRSQAVLLAQDMAERIRTNSNYVLTTENIDTSEYTVSYNREYGDSDCVNNNCTPTQMARFDVDQWLNSLGSTLPAGDGQITKTNLNYQVTVRWDTTRSGNENDLKSYTLNLNLRS